ncbi:hypothetical protein J5X84_30645 [Streptosporangiaceae bacterium NEAU-GS5]|nr:hypothetical protein [Streptosporangiaceae bacterium NEAU-GS5]
MTAAVAAGDRPHRESLKESVDELVQRMLPRLEWAVEPLQVAAALESDGITDRIARDRYGFADVFDLAHETFSRLGRPAPPPAPAAESPQARAFAQVAHGLLYALPAALLPAASAIVGVNYLMPGLVVTTAVGWIWGSAGARVAYGLLGRGLPQAAGRTLRGTMLIGLAGALVSIGALSYWQGGGPGLVVLCGTQMAFQMSAAVLLFYRGEGWLGALMAPAVVAGVAYLLIGEMPVALVAVELGIGSVAVITACAVTLTYRVPADPARRPLLTRSELPRQLPSLGYSVLSAFFLLQAEATYVLGRTDIAIAGVPLVLGMGVVEYRTHRFEDQARDLLRRIRYPRQFTGRTRRMLLRGLAICLLSLALPAAGLLALLHTAGPVAPEVVVMASAHVVIGGGYFLAFVLANQGKTALLCVAQCVALAIHPGLWLLPPGPRTPILDVTVFLAAGVSFLLILLGFAMASLRHVQQYG